jgi:hypothetical protein
MKKLILSALVAVAAVIGAGAANLSPATAADGQTALMTRLAIAPVSLPTGIEGVTAEHLPPVGECKIWYNDLPADAQPARMDCEHATWLAQRWGGRVIANTQDGALELAAYEGRNDFTGVPVNALPSHGSCRAWVDGRAVHEQPAESDCRTARRTAEEEGGRVLYMPL